jgi:Terminase-like family.
MSGSLSFIQWALTNFDYEDFAFVGKTIGTCLRNVIIPLKGQIAKMGAEYKEHRSSTEGYHLDIFAGGHQNRFWVFGGKDESSQDLIQGKTLAGVFFDEVLLMPQSFVVQAQARTSVEGATCWYTLNPDTPQHWFYAESLAMMEESESLFYLHMTFDDNPSLSEKVKERYRRMWPKHSIYYRRYVLGERCAAEGAIYPFDWEPGAGPVVLSVPNTFSLYIMGVDYGSRNDFHAVLLGLNSGIWYAIKEYVWSGRSQGGDLLRDTWTIWQTYVSGIIRL